MKILIVMNLQSHTFIEHEAQDVLTWLPVSYLTTTLNRSEQQHNRDVSIEIWRLCLTGANAQTITILQTEDLSFQVN